MLSVGTVVLGVSDVARAEEFWSQALDYVRRDTGPVDDWVILRPANNGSGTHLALMLSETPVQEHPRVHLDLYADDQEAESRRLLALGASRVDWDGYEEDADYLVLADSEGNRFCVIDKSSP